MFQQNPNFKISFVRRQANCVAHSIARTSKLYARQHIFDLILFYISTIVMNEIMSYCFKNRINKFKIVIKLI